MRQKRVPIDYSRALEARETEVKLDKTIGIHKISAEESSKNLGYFCKVCDLSTNDSLSWLDHLNSPHHNRMFGNQMKVEKVGLTDIEQRLQDLKKKTPKKKPPTIEEIMKRLESAEPAPSKKQKLD